MDLTSDPVAMSINRARRIINLQIERGGHVYGNVRLVDQLPTPYTGGIDGIGWFYQAALRNNPNSLDIYYTDLLLWASAGFLFGGQPGANLLVDKVSNISFVGGGITGYVSFACFFLQKRVRFFSLSSEILMVQDGGLIMLRAYFSPTLGQGFYRAGIEPPVANNLTLSAVGTGLTGTWGYKITYADERFRESSPSPAVNITLTNNATHAVASNIGSFTPPASYGGSNLRYAYLYRNTIAAPDVFYRVAEATLPTTNLSTYTFKAGDYINDLAAANDNSADAVITAGTLAPQPGENDPPLAASVGCIHKNRVFLNSIDNANTLQVSNAGSATQFAAIFNVDTPTDGGRFEIGSDQGNTITALVEFGSVLAIFKRRGSYFLYGDSLADFIVRPVHQRGCIAPDSAARCDNVVCFLSDDGVYAASYEAGEVVTKISKEIERELLSASIEEREASVGWYVDQRYHLSVGTIIYVYDFGADPDGWTCYVFGSGSLAVGEGLPVATVEAGVGFGDLGNSALYGSVVFNDTCEVVGQDPPPLCATEVTPTALAFDGDGGTQTLQVTPQNATPTTYASYAFWLSINGPQLGPGTATVLCAENDTCFDRTGTVQICDQVITVTQTQATSGCSCDMLSLTPDTFNVDHTAQTVTTNYVLVAPATITYQSSVGWLHPHAPVASTSTTGHMDIDVDENDTCQDRTGTVQICDLMVTVNQAADPGCGCNVIINPTLMQVAPASSGIGNFTATNLTAGTYSCTTDRPDIITITVCSGNAGVGSSGVSFNYDFNSVVDDTPAHIFLCNAIFTIINDQHS